MKITIGSIFINIFVNLTYFNVNKEVVQQIYQITQF
jgi:hypothetical protein